MGYKLAGQVQQQWSHLDHGPYRLLIGIALALPEDSTRCWFGRDRFAQLLGKTPVTEAEKENAYKSVQRTIKALITAEALRLVSAAKPGKSAVYQLLFGANGGHSASTLTEGMGDVQCPPLEREWGTLSVPNGGRSATPMVDVQGPEWGTPDVHPKKKEEEVQEEVKKPRASKAALEKQMTEDFEAWYAIYPKHEGKKPARTAYAKARKNGATLEELISGAQRFAAKRKGQDPGFTAMPATWLNQERWTDEAGSSTVQDGPWSKTYHSQSNIPPQYAWANRPDHGDRALAKGAAMIAALEAKEQQPREIQERTA
ncbi:hypothetical protein [Arthrobacter sp. NPDC058127]|uniref:hypothetical protein n=1 Tax=Arthrobacter sp. NPDC058127 TaxID=3346351 RepID=UPI0036F0AEDD